MDLVIRINLSPCCRPQLLVLPVFHVRAAGEARETVTSSGNLDVEGITAFVNGDKLPLSLEFNSDNSERIFKSGIDKHVGAVQYTNHGSLLGFWVLPWMQCSTTLVARGPVSNRAALFGLLLEIFLLVQLNRH